jgi:hypothetical protein
MVLDYLNLLNKKSWLDDIDLTYLITRSILIL